MVKHGDIGGTQARRYGNHKSCTENVNDNDAGGQREDGRM